VIMADPQAGKDPPAPIRPLSVLVGGEARRVLNDEQLRADPVLLADGWERRFITDRGRVEEMTALYRDLGYEVRVESIAPADVGDDCEDCQLVRYRFCMIYTRRDTKPPVGGEERSNDR